MTSTRERQRAAARARLAKEMAERASTARRKRQRQAVIGAGVALVLVVGGVIWLVTALGDDSSPTGAATDQPAAALCVWNEVPAESRTPQTVDVGLPTTTAPPNTGTEVMTVDTSFGPVEVTIDRAKAPCAGEAFSFLASKKFWDGTKCHRMFPGMLQCGDPTAKGAGYRDTDGMGGPTFRYANENLPTDEVPPYPEGVVALANSGPDTNGSQFFFIYQDVQLSPDYTVLGKVTAGLDNIKKATAAGHNGKFDPSPGGGNPKSDIEIKSITVTPGA